MSFKTRHLLLILSTLFIFLFPSLSSANQTSTENTAPLLKEEITNLNSNIERYSLDSETEAEKKATDINLDESEAEVQSEDTENNLIEGEEQTEDADNTLIEGEEQAEDKDNTLIESEEQAEDKDNTLIEGEEQTKDKDNTLIEGEEQTEKSDSLSKTTPSKKESRTKNASSKSTTLKKGDRNNRVIQLKKDLNKLGFSGIKVTNYFGDFMEKRVKEFQTYFYLKSTGIIDDTTETKIKKNANTPFQRGKRHSKTVENKVMLNKLGFGHIKTTNLFGSFNEKKVKEFQKYFGLKQNGIIDDRTLSTLQKNANTPFQRGKRHDKTVENKVMLNKLGFGHIKTTNLFGSFNEKKVKEFQKYFGLKQNGIIDDRTLSTLQKNANTPFQRGKRHSGTVNNKKMLNKLGFGHIKTTNLFGSFSEKKVKEFQKYFGLKQNGIIDDRTLSTLQKNANTSFQRGKRHNDIRNFKTILNSNGYGKIKVTTLYGDFMEKRVTKFQQDNNLVANGIIDSVTENALHKLNEKIRIFIDPGHGGHDPGASRYGLKEKDIVLDISLRLKRELESKYSNVEVMMSRSNDSFVELEDRAKMANDWNADYFISLHNNSYSNSSASGFESYIHNSNSSQSNSAKYQNIIHDEIVKDTNVKDRGKKSANFSVLRNTEMPAILIEYLFISNPSDNKKLGNPSFRQKLATLTANGLAKAFNLK